MNGFLYPPLRKAQVSRKVYCDNPVLHCSLVHKLFDLTRLASPSEPASTWERIHDLLYGLHGLHSAHAKCIQILSQAKNAPRAGSPAGAHGQRFPYTAPENFAMAPTLLSRSASASSNDYFSLKSAAHSIWSTPSSSISSLFSADETIPDWFQGAKGSFWSPTNDHPNATICSVGSSVTNNVDVEMFAAELSKPGWPIPAPPTEACATGTETDSFGNELSFRVISRNQDVLPPQWEDPGPIGSGSNTSSDDEGAVRSSNTSSSSSPLNSGPPFMPRSDIGK